MYEASEQEERGLSRDRLHSQWGDAVSSGMTGFTAVPDVLLRKQVELDLTNTELVVLLNVLMHWWSADSRPFPSNVRIAQRMGSTSRTVQRCMASLESKGLIRRVSIPTQTGGEQPRTRREIDLTRLVSRLEEEAEGLRAYSKASIEARQFERAISR